MAGQQQQGQGQNAKPPAPVPAKPPIAASTAPEKTRAERFKELAPKRTRGILKALEILGNCSNKSGYEYTDQDILKIFGAIDKKVAETKARFSATGKDKEISFTL